MEMIERVAKAIFASDMKWAPVLEHQFEENKIVYLKAASAAIEAMREPTDAMGFAGICEWTREEPTADQLAANPSKWIRPTWHAMIDAALSTTPTSPEA